MMPAAHNVPARSVGAPAGSFTAAVEAHGAVALRITPLDKAGRQRHEAWRPWSDTYGVAAAAAPRPSLADSAVA